MIPRKRFRPLTLTLFALALSLATVTLAGCAALTNWKARQQAYKQTNEQQGREAADAKDPAMGAVHDSAEKGVALASAALPPPLDLIALAAGNLLLGSLFGRRVGYVQRGIEQTRTDAAWDEASASARGPAATPARA